ncbi:TIGR00730 family Rossman fold protein [Parabacteroides sp. Marseille-P3160]|uniref:LOG family protein n=1 Tax=Parabacteroides sp. Marseille-P3160 TaxID=1917887 RepID=UPI0009BA840E|nr:TIGR00730 family Rossman fold protein [Parabacteroides sp. Marseille-P3160]
MKRITVYCGSSTGSDPEYKKQAYALGQLLAEQKIGLVYGGGKVGLMGELANGALDAKGEVIGVIPAFLEEKELAHPDASEMIVTQTMHERKEKMCSLGDGFIALPGGFGTLEELFETVTWAQLGLHRKPIGLLNTGGYFDALLRFIDETIEKKFIKPEYRSLLLVGEQPSDLLGQMRTFVPCRNEKWFEPARII